MSERNASRPTSTCDGGPQIRLLIQACGFSSQAAPGSSARTSSERSSIVATRSWSSTAWSRRYTGTVCPRYRRASNSSAASVGDRTCADVALAGVEAVVHLAAAVGVGQSMYEIERYVHVNTLATASFLERVVAERPGPRATRRRLLDVDLRRGRVPTAPPTAPSRRARVPTNSSWSAGGSASACTVGRSSRPIATRESKPLIPTSVYAVTKRDHEELCHVVGSAYGVPTVALRFFNVYGPGQALSNPYTGVAAIFSSRLLNSKPPLVFEDGQQSRDFIHVSDIVAGILLALESDAAVGQSINLGTGRATSIDEVAALLADALGVGLEPERPGSYRTGDIRHCYADTAQAHELLGFTAAVRTRGRDRGARGVARESDGRGSSRRCHGRAEVARGLAR